MKGGTEDQVKGKFHEVKGIPTARVAKAAGNPEQLAEGRDEKIAGKVQKKVGTNFARISMTRTPSILVTAGCRTFDAGHP